MRRIIILHNHSCHNRPCLKTLPFLPSSPASSTHTDKHTLQVVTDACILFILTVLLWASYYSTLPGFLHGKQHSATQRIIRSIEYTFIYQPVACLVYCLLTFFLYNGSTYNLNLKQSELAIINKTRFNKALLTNRPIFIDDVVSHNVVIKYVDSFRFLNYKICNGDNTQTH